MGKHIFCSLLLLVVGVWCVDKSVVRNGNEKSDGQRQVGYEIRRFGQLDKKKLWKD